MKVSFNVSRKFFLLLMAGVGMHLVGCSSERSEEVGSTEQASILAICTTISCADPNAASQECESQWGSTNDAGRTYQIPCACDGTSNCTNSDCWSNCFYRACTGAGTSGAYGTTLQATLLDGGAVAMEASVAALPANATSDLTAASTSSVVTLAETEVAVTADAGGISCTCGHSFFGIHNYWCCPGADAGNVTYQGWSSTNSCQTAIAAPVAPVTRATPAPM